jgi:uncharacterized protein YutE (UPF0331/DUF86 family)
MDPLRKTRYHDKIEYLHKNIADVKDSYSNELEKKGIFYSIQTSIETVIDLVAMLTKDLGYTIKADSDNIDLLCDHFDLSPDLGSRLKTANGLRNILVHRYNGVEDEIVFNAITEIRSILTEWLEIIVGEVAKIE